MGDVGSDPDRGSFVCSDGATLAVFEWNATAAGPPIILHHGFTVNTEFNWIAPGIIAALAATGRRTIAFDARCHGASEKFLDPARTSRMRMARDVIEIADHAGADSYDLAGYSLGGFVAIVSAVEDPRVRRLALCGSCEQLFADQLRHPVLSGVPAALRADDPQSVANPVTRAFRLLADRIGSDRLALAACFEGFNADWQISGEAVPKLRIPTLVIGGRDDFIMIGVERLTDVIPDNRLVWTEGDHITALNDPKFAQELVAFFEFRVPETPSSGDTIPN